MEGNVCSDSTTNGKKGKEGKKKEKKSGQAEGTEEEKEKCIQTPKDLLTIHTHIHKDTQTNMPLTFSLLLSVPPSLLRTPPSSLVLTLFAVFVNSVQFNPLVHPLQHIHSYVNSHGKKRNRTKKKEGGHAIDNTPFQNNSQSFQAHMSTHSPHRHRAWSKGKKGSMSLLTS